MQCPSCQSERLLMTERAGVEIDYCPKCRGVWLDRGELDKIIERSGDEAAGSPGAPPAGPNQPAPAPHAQPMPPYRAPHDSMDDSDYGRYEYRQGKPMKRRKSFLREIFDFD